MNPYSQFTVEMKMPLFFLSSTTSSLEEEMNYHTAVSWL